MIIIKNTQRKIRIDIKKLEQQTQKMLTQLGYKDFDLGILITTNATIRRYNKTYRHKDKATDILSFPYHTELKPGQRIKIKNPEDKNLGDIIISAEYAHKDAPITWNRRFDNHLTALMAHGILHLLGHDHESDKDFRVMHQAELKLLARIQ